MQHTHKQIIVMFFSVLFMAIVGIIVLSASASAQATHADRVDDMLQSADDHLADQKPHIHHTFSDERIPTPPTTRYFDDEPVVYDDRSFEIDRMQDDISSLQEQQINTDEGDFSDRITKGIWALIIIAIIGFILYCIFGDAPDTPKPRGTPKPYIPDADTPYTPDTPDDTVIPETVIGGADVDDYDHDTFIKKWDL